MLVNCPSIIFINDMFLIDCSFIGRFTSKDGTFSLRFWFWWFIHAISCPENLICHCQQLRLHRHSLETPSSRRGCPSGAALGPLPTHWTKVVLYAGVTGGSPCRMTAWRRMQCAENVLVCSIQLLQSELEHLPKPPIGMIADCCGQYVA